MNQEMDQEVVGEKGVGVVVERGQNMDARYPDWARVHFSPCTCPLGFVDP